MTLSKRAIKQMEHKVSETLGEKKRNAREQIRKIIELCGAEFVEVLLKDTLEIEEQGGLMTLDGKRRRTPGGVFLRLAKERVTDEQRKLLFPPYWSNEKRKKEAANSQSPEPEQTQAAAFPLSDTNGKLQQLERAAIKLRERVEEIKAKPEAQQTGLKIIERLLANTEAQIKKLRQEALPQ